MILFSQGLRVKDNRENSFTQKNGSDSDGVTPCQRQLHAGPILRKLPVSTLRRRLLFPQRYHRIHPIWSARPE
jgi:hypothetical protein